MHLLLPTTPSEHQSPSQRGMGPPQPHHPRPYLAGWVGGSVCWLLAAARLWPLAWLLELPTVTKPPVSVSQQLLLTHSPAEKQGWAQLAPQSSMALAAPPRPSPVLRPPPRSPCTLWLSALPTAPKQNSCRRRGPLPERGSGGSPASSRDGDRGIPPGLCRPQELFCCGVRQGSGPAVWQLGMPGMPELGLTRSRARQASSWAAASALAPSRRSSSSNVLMASA